MTTGGDASEGFFARWSRRKEIARDGSAVAPVAAPVQTVAAPEPAPLAEADAHAPALPPAPTMEDVAQLTPESDYSRFVAAHVDTAVKRAAMKKLFSDPHFNVMDGLDTYIADYGQPDPIPPAMLRQMNQSKLLRLFEVETDGASTPAEAPAGAPDTLAKAAPTHDDDADLRLQQDDDPGRPGPGEGARA